MSRYTVRSDFLDSQEERFRVRVSKTADELRKLADRIEREGNDSSFSNASLAQGNAFTTKVMDIEHEIVWSVANLQTATLMSIALDADYAARQAIADAKEQS